VKGSREPNMKFCDVPLYLGTVEARNFKFGTEINQNFHYF